MSKDLKELQTERCFNTAREFSEYVHKIQDMPVIRVTKKKDNNNNKDNNDDFGKIGRIGGNYDKGK